MDEHLLRVHQLTVESLQMFEEKGIKFDADFLLKFLELTSEKVAEAYKYFLNECKNPKKVPSERKSNSPRDRKRNIELTEEQRHHRTKVPKTNGLVAATSKQAQNGHGNGSEDFLCVACQDSNALTKFHGSIENVRTHWSVKHPNQEPFGFYLMEPIAYFQCNSNANGQLKGTILIMSQLDPRINSVRTKYQEQLLANIVNPFPLTDEKLDRLLQSNNGQRDNGNVDLSKPIGNGLAENQCHQVRGTPLFMICSYCNLKLRREKYLLHLKEHCQSLSCFECGACVGSLADIFAHDIKEHGVNRIDYQCSKLSTQLFHTFLNTKIVFGNGLILHNLNLVGTKLDRSANHNAFVESMIDLEKVKYTKLADGDGQMEMAMVVETELTVEAKSHVEVNGNGNQNGHGSKNGHGNRNGNGNRNGDGNRNGNGDGCPEENKVELEDDSLLLAELKKQKSIINNLIIRAIPHIKDLNLMELFLAFCKKVEVDVCADDIKSIERSDDKSDAIIVQFHHLKKKMLVRKAAMDKETWLHELIELPSGVKMAKVYANAQVTPFYAEIQKIAKAARKIGTLYSHQLRHDGFFVKRTSEMKEERVLSKQQLRNYIGTLNMEHFHWK